MNNGKGFVDRKRNQIVGIFAFGMLFLMCILIVLGAAVQKVCHTTKQDGINGWEASKYYPLETEEGVMEYSVIERISTKIAAVENKIEQKATTSFYFKMPFVLIKKVSDKALGLDMTVSLCAGENDLNSANDIVLAYEKDYLGFVMDDVDFTEKIENVILFANQMKNEGRNFLFFMTPEKYKGNEVYHNYSEEKKKEILDIFEEKDVDIVCLSEIIDEKNMASVFFKTDHHWLPSAGIWADGMLCGTLNEKYGYDFDISIFNIGNYEIDIREASFLGSQGKKVTEVYCQKEDFPIILPAYDTDLEVFISEKGKTCRGAIEDTLLDYSVFDETDSYIRNDYSFYGYGDQALVDIHNNDIHDGSKILVIKTSFADSMYPYLAAVIENLYVIDLRYFNGSLQSYIKETNPDTVIMIYGMGAFESEDGNELFDFR